MTKGTMEVLIRDADGVEFHRHRHDVDDVDAAADHVAELEPDDQKSDRTLALGGDRRGKASAKRSRGERRRK